MLNSRYSNGIPVRLFCEWMWPLTLGISSSSELDISGESPEPSESSPLHSTSSTSLDSPLSSLSSIFRRLRLLAFPFRFCFFCRCWSWHILTKYSNIVVNSEKKAERIEFSSHKPAKKLPLVLID